MSATPKGLAKISWTDPETGDQRHYVLTEGATVTVGRSRNNEVCIPHQHVSRQHAVITHQYGVFMISDLNSANGTFVNDEPLTEGFPLAHGDIIKLYVPTIKFSGHVTEEDEAEAVRTGSLIVAMDAASRPRIIITSGPQEGTEFPVYQNLVTFGRMVTNASWDIRLQDRSVSRPHAKIEKRETSWFITDLGSANGTVVNNKLISEPALLKDGYVITMGQTTVLFRLGGTEAETFTG